MKKLIYPLLLASLIFSSRISYAGIYSNTQSSLKDRASAEKDKALALKYEEEVKTERAKKVLYYSIGGSTLLLSTVFIIKNVLWTQKAWHYRRPAGRRIPNI